MNTTIQSSQGQTKTKPLLEKQLLQLLFDTQAFGVFMQKSQNLPLQEVPGRKSVPVAQPLLRPKKTKAMQASRHLILQNGHSILEQEAGA